MNNQNNSYFDDRNNNPENQQPRRNSNSNDNNVNSFQESSWHNNFVAQTPPLNQPVFSPNQPFNDLLTNDHNFSQFQVPPPFYPTNIVPYQAQNSSAIQNNNNNNRQINPPLNSIPPNNNNFFQNQNNNNNNFQPRLPDLHPAYVDCGWEQHFSSRYNKHFYYNKTTLQSVWSLPSLNCRPKSPEFPPFSQKTQEDILRPQIEDILNLPEFEVKQQIGGGGFRCELLKCELFGQFLGFRKIVNLGSHFGNIFAENNHFLTKIG